MRFPSTIRRLRNTQGGMRSTARSGSTPYDPYTDPPSDEPFGVTAAASPQTVSLGTAVTFTGTVSNPPDGAVLSYLWDFSDKANPTAGGSGVRVPYTYPTHGVKTATLTVADAVSGLTASDDVIITVIELSLDGPGTVTRGDTVMYRTTVEPNRPNTTFSWQFMNTEGEDRVTIPAEDEITDTWGGQIVVSGVIEVTATVNDIPFTKEKTITVNERNERLWSDDFPLLPTTNNGQGSLPVDPRVYEELGQTHITPPDVEVDITPPVAGGPNRGWMFVQSAPTGAWLHSADINQALYNRRHRFYVANINRLEGPLYMARLAENVEIHEGVTLERGYKSHASRAGSYLYHF